MRSHDLEPQVTSSLGIMHKSSMYRSRHHLLAYDFFVIEGTSNVQHCLPEVSQYPPVLCCTCGSWMTTRSRFALQWGEGTAQRARITLPVKRTHRYLHFYWAVNREDAKKDVVAEHPYRGLVCGLAVVNRLHSIIDKTRFFSRTGLQGFWAFKTSLRSKTVEQVWTGRESKTLCIRCEQEEAKIRYHAASRLVTDRRLNWWRTDIMHQGQPEGWWKSQWTTVLHSDKQNKSIRDSHFLIITNYHFYTFKKSSNGQRFYLWVTICI